MYMQKTCTLCKIKYVQQKSHLVIEISCY